MIKRIGKFEKYIYSLIDQCLVSGANFLGLVLVARFCSNEVYANFYFIYISIIFSINVLQKPFIGGPISVLSQKADTIVKKNYFYCSVFTTQIFVTVSTLIVISGILFYKGINDPNIYLSTNIALVFIGLHELFRSILFANLRPSKVLISDIIANSIRIAGFSIVIKFIDFAYLISGVIFTIAFSSFIGAIIGFGISGLKFKFVFDKSHISKNFNFAKWLSLEAFLSSLSFRAYILIVSAFIDEKSFAIFAACSVIAQILNIILSGLFNMATPVAAKKFNQSEIIFNEFLKTLKLYGSAFIISISIGTYALKKIIFKFVFNDRFNNYEYVLLILLLANIAFFYQYINVMILKIHGRVSVISFTRFLVALFSLTVGVLLAKQYSIEGVSFSIAVSAIIAWIILKGYISKIYFIKYNT